MTSAHEISEGLPSRQQSAIGSLCHSRNSLTYLGSLGTRYALIICGSLFLTPCFRHLERLRRSLRSSIRKKKLTPLYLKTATASCMAPAALFECQASELCISNRETQIYLGIMYGTTVIKSGSLIQNQFRRTLMSYLTVAHSSSWRYCAEVTTTRYVFSFSTFLSSSLSA